MTAKKRKPVKGSLYGIHHSNREDPADLWGKNQFNSAFPAALACYMRDKDIPSVYLTLQNDLRVAVSDLPISQLFNSTLANHELQFDFESQYKPYSEHAADDIGGIDLIVKHYGDNGETGWCRPLEVKLTVLPDNTTCKRPEEYWGTELVIRPTTTKYCALGIYHECRGRRTEIRDIFHEFCANFESWDSTHELWNKRKQLLSSLNVFQETFRDKQQPFLMQPIWKTDGKSPSLSEQAFDIFVWSDFALCRAFINKLESDKQVSRFTRAAARLARMLYALSTQEKPNLSQIYTGMALGVLTDKEFSLPGQLTRTYLDTPRRLRPALSRDVVAEIILGGGEKLLSPERRFDATVFFTARTIFEVREAERETAKAAIEVEELGVNNLTPN